MYIPVWITGIFSLNLVCLRHTLLQAIKSIEAQVVKTSLAFVVQLHVLFTAEQVSLCFTFKKLHIHIIVHHLLRPKNSLASLQGNYLHSFKEQSFTFKNEDIKCPVIYYYELLRRLIIYFLFSPWITSSRSPETQRTS